MGAVYIDSADSITVGLSALLAAAHNLLLEGKEQARSQLKVPASIKF